MRRTFQFDVQSLVWLTVTIGFCLSFLRTFGIEVVVEGIAVIASAAVLGLVIGFPRRRLADVVYWSVLGRDSSATILMLLVVIANHVERYLAP